jgi:hypothetical protein
LEGAGVSATAEVLEEKKFVLQIMDDSGHSEVQWDPDDEEEVAKAKEAFEAAIKKGYYAYTLKPGGTQGEIIKTFDPTAGRIVMRPPMVGG